MAIIERGIADCYTAISELDDAMQDVLVANQRYYVLGGIASGAIRHPESVIDPVSRLLYAAADSSEPTVRDNGTTRDVDILVDDVIDDEWADLIKAQVTEATGGSLVVSVFGIDRHDPEKNSSSRFKSSVADWISRRTIDEQGTHRYELYPLEQVVPPESYEPWTLLMPNGRRVAVLSPAGHVLAYAMRSISGVRAKDVEKLDGMINKVFDIEELKAEIKDGVFRPWLDFACGLYDLRDGRLSADSPLLAESSSRADRLAFRMKGKFLHMLEGQEKIVDFAQGEQVQKMLNIFVRAK